MSLHSDFIILLIFKINFNVILFFVGVRKGLPFSSHKETSMSNLAIYIYKHKVQLLNSYKLAAIRDRMPKPMSIIYFYRKFTYALYSILNLIELFSLATLPSTNIKFWESDLFKPHWDKLLWVALVLSFSKSMYFLKIKKLLLRFVGLWEAVNSCLWWDLFFRLRI